MQLALPPGPSGQDRVFTLVSPVQAPSEVTSSSSLSPTLKSKLQFPSTLIEG